jgi:sugar/nucleoside kinase (ribokinase family)
VTADILPAVSVDLAVLTPAFLDYTFVGLEALPGPGEERFAGDMLRTPGGGAITAVAGRRLGLSTVLVAPLGDDLAGRFVRRALEDEGVATAEPRGTRTPTTVVLPVAGERSMVTVDPGVRARASDLEAHSPRAVAATLDQLYLIPSELRAYVTCGDDDARAFAGRIPHTDCRAFALIVNRRQSEVLTGGDPPSEAARKLAEVADVAVVTLGARGIVAAVDGGTVEVGGIDAQPVVDTTGAGDLFATAFAWADLHGAEPAVALQWANLYAGLSVTAHTGIGGAVTRSRLLEEGDRRGLPELPASARAE